MRWDAGAVTVAAAVDIRFIFPIDLSTRQAGPVETSYKREGKPWEIKFCHKCCDIMTGRS